MARRPNTPAAPVLLSRDEFRESVFARDGQLCVNCGAPAADAHHIIERRLFREPHEHGGYFLENGASVCEPCHLKAESTELDAAALRELCAITRVVLPAHLYEGQRYDKWGNPIMPNGTRLRGELFHDESVQKILAAGPHLGDFTHLIRAPRTYHLPWSAGMHNDDRMMPTTEFLEGRRVIATEKMDGENTSIYTRDLHARSPDGRSHPSRDRVKAWASRFQHEIPEDWRLVGENLTAVHSIAYTDLPHIFLGFQVWNEQNICLSWDETLEWFQLLGITPVRVLYDGPWDPAALSALYDHRRDWESREGYVVRLADSFAMSEYPRAVGKFVRENHVQTAKHHWATQAVIPNGLAPGVVI